MNTQIRRLGIVMLVLFSALFVQLNYLQVLGAKRLNDHPGNTRAVARDFSRPRGLIQTSDGVVVAVSEDSADQFERLRRYPEGPLFSHLTGYFSFTYGTEGLERTYNDVLTGRKTKLRLDRLGDLLLERKPTNDVTLTVSKRVQQDAANALGQRKGAVVALDPRTGGLLAMVDYPSYDPNPLAAHDQKAVRGAWTQLNADADRPLLSRAYRERYFPGSSFKVVTAATALATGTATPTEPSYPVLSELPLPDSSEALRNFGVPPSSCGGNLTEALRVSCNTVFAQLGLDLGADKLSAGARSFGFGDAPPIDLPFAASSVFPDASAFERDRPGLAKSAIGQQDVSATPLQMALVAAGIANDGMIMKPHAMAEVRDSEGSVIDRYKPDRWQQAVSADVAHSVRDMMIGVVQGGSGTRAQLAGVQVAGKTGTAQTGLDKSHVWFIAFAPAEAPRVAVAVVLENQPSANEVTGGALAAPIARAVLQSALAGP